MRSVTESQIHFNAAFKENRVCTHCIMDTTDPDITFDASGVCSYCTQFESDYDLKRNWFPNAEGKKRLSQFAREIQIAGHGREYDGIIGLSGGVDSSFTAYQAKRLGLRLMVVHIDAGWNSELAVKNVENIVKKLGFDLYTYVVDWEEMQDLQLAFLKSGVANTDIPQDHVYTAMLYRLADEKGIPCILNGNNYATEYILPTAWGYHSLDLRQLKSIHRRFGTRKLKTFPTIDFIRYFFYYPHIRKIRVLSPLNYMPYNKAEAMRILEDELGWRPYGRKHGESRFTKFFQNYCLPKRFGYDKRIAHLSSLIVTGQMSRNDAIQEMEKELYPPGELREDKEFILKKLGLSDTEFENLMRLPQKTYKDYPSDERLLEFMNMVRNILIRFKLW